MQILVYGLCVLHGYVSSIYLKGPLKRTLVPLADDGFLEAVAFVVRECEMKRNDNFIYQEIVYLLVEVSLLTQFVNSALKIQCHVVKNTPTDWAILPIGYVSLRTNLKFYIFLPKHHKKLSLPIPSRC